MPTAAKLFAGIAFALVAYLSADVFKAAMPEGTQFGFFSPVSALIGFLSGWMVMGRLAGHGYGQAAGYGLRTAVTIVFFALVLFSLYEMVLLSMKLRYDGPVAALLGAFDLALGYAQKMLRADFLIVLLGGGALAGILTEWANKRWS